MELTSVNAIKQEIFYDLTYAQETVKPTDLNEETANLRLQELTQLIEQSSSDFERCSYALEKLALHMYLGNLEGVMTDLEALEDELLLEGETAHSLLNWAASGDTTSVMELAKFPNPMILLLLKATAVSLPEAAVFEEGSEIEKQLFARNYLEALKLLDEQLQDSTLSFYDRELALQNRGFCKAMLGDYEGALQDYDAVISAGPVINAEEVAFTRGIVHFLNHDVEKARADLWVSHKDGMTMDNLKQNFLQMGDFSGFAIAHILSL